MTFEEAKVLARQGIKMTNKYFSKGEWMIMHGNQIQFEDGVKIFAQEWIAGKVWLLDGWSEYKE